MARDAPTPTRRPSWFREDQEELAVDRLLDAAGDAFVRLGVEATRMEDVAAAAACSRGTVYRYFATREALRAAYVARETTRVAEVVESRIAHLTDPADQLVEAMATALDAVRANPLLKTWFRAESTGITAELASTSPTIAALVASFLDDLFARAARQHRLRARLDRAGAAEWVVRIMVSLLTVEMRPRSRSQEATYLRSFLVPALFVDG